MSVTEKISLETRSRMMSGIRGRDTKPELTVRSFLHRAGLRYRLHSRSLPGKPDVILPRWNAAVFVHGCFWHGHSGCRFFRLPKTRAEFWEAKIRSNVARDAKVLQALSDAGWRTAVIWECALRDDAVRSLDRLASFIRSDMVSIEIGTA
jgi:DNA mismatch endonuclease, patch repair protein